jgi:serine/threonine protein kinase
VARVISGKYEVLSQIGKGGMGEVYQVRHRTLDTLLALKVLPAELAKDADRVRRFHQEARVMAQLRHPNIVHVKDVDRDGDIHYFVMEYVEGTSLSQYLRERGSLALAEVLYIARQLVLALEYAHNHHPPVIHRDIKPANILLEERSKRVVVTDFGIAKIQGDMEQTRTGLVMGTLRYCAPERLQQTKDLDGRVDIYSLGLVMYEMAAGQPFFTEVEQPALLSRILHGPGENIPTFTSSAPPEFVALVTRAIAREREHRYLDATAMLQDIEKCQARSPGTAFTVLQKNSPSPSREKAEQEESKDKVRQSPRVLPSRRHLLIGGVIAGVSVPVLALLSQHPFILNVLSLVEKGGERTPLPKGPQPLLFAKDKREIRAVGVMHFKALGNDPQSGWMRDAIRDNFNSQLSSAVDLKVYSTEYIDFLVQKRSSTEIEIASELGIAKMISGSFLAVANKLRIEAYVVDVESGFLEAADHIEGEQTDFFQLQRQLATKIMARLNVAGSPRQGAAGSSAPETPSLDRYKLLLQADGETVAVGSTKEQVPRPQGSSQGESDKHSHIPLQWIWPRATMAWADEGLKQELTPEAEIREVLEVYRRAYEKKDFTLLDSVFDRVSPAQKEALTQYFRFAHDLRVTLRDIDIAVSGDEAAVSCTREDRFVDAETGRSVKIDTRFTKILARADGTWKIIGKK